MTIEEIKLILVKGDLKELSAALSNFSINEVDQHGSNILHYYIKSLKDLKIAPTDFFAELDKHKFDYDARQEKKFKRTPMGLAVFMKSKEIFDLLLKRKVDVNLEDENGNPPLFDAVFKYDGDDYFIKQLLKADADPNKENLHGVSPLKLANNIANTDVKKFFAVKA
jgi:ankyrin repeat protein